MSLAPCHNMKQLDSMKFAENHWTLPTVYSGVTVGNLGCRRRGFELKVDLTLVCKRFQKPVFFGPKRIKLGKNLTLD